MKRQAATLEVENEEQKINRMLNVFKNAVYQAFFVRIKLNNSEIIKYEHGEEGHTGRHSQRLELISERREEVVRVGFSDVVVSVDEANQPVIGKMITAPVMWCELRKKKQQHIVKKEPKGLTPFSI